MSDGATARGGSDTERWVRFVEKPAAQDTVLMRFADPEPCCAILCQREIAGDDGQGDATLQVRIASPAVDRQSLAEWLADGSGAQQAVLTVKCRGGQILWRPGRAVLACEPGQVEDSFSAVVEFAYYEQQLRSLESEIAAAWPGLHEDNTLAFDVSPADLRRSNVVGERMSRTFLRRIRYARLEPHLHEPSPGASESALKSGEDLRSHSGLESRAEALDAQMEVFEHIYEMGSQRIGEYRASRQGHIMEWVIIVLLAAEILLMLWQVLWKPHA